MNNLCGELLRTPEVACTVDDFYDESAIARAAAASAARGEQLVLVGHSLGAHAVLRIAAEVSGPVLQPYDAGYAEEIAAFNVAVVHRPAVVVGAATSDDVRAALRYAAAHGLPVAVQATGHGATTPSSRPAIAA